MHQKITQEYTDNRERLARSFPAASEFLLRLEQHGAEHDVWLSTTKNAHLYKGARFLAYIRLTHREQPAESLVLSATPNKGIAEGTRDASYLLFPDALGELLTRHRGLESEWATREPEGAIVLLASTPSEFFADFFDLLMELGEGSRVTLDSEVELGAFAAELGERRRPSTQITLGLENFKGVRDPVSIELRPLTLLFGPNSAGKSTLLQALLYLHELLERNNTDAGTTALGGDAVDLGGFARLVHGRDLSREVAISLNVGGAGFDVGSLAFGRENDWLDECPVGIGVALRVGWSSRLGRPIVRSFETEYAGHRVATITCNEDGTRTEVAPNPACRLYFRRLVEPADVGAMSELAEWSRSFAEAVKGPIPARLSARGALLLEGHALVFDEYQQEKLNEAGYAGLAQAVSRIVTQIASTVRDFLRELIYVGPLRELPPRNYQPPRMPDRGRWARGLAAWDLLHYRGTSEVHALGQVLSRDLHTGYHLEVEETMDRRLVEWAMDGAPDLATAIAQSKAVEGERRIRLCQDTPPGLRVAPSDVGVGISQLLPVAAAVTLDLCPEQWDTQPLIVIEQPELHVHPAIQVELGDMFIRGAGVAANASYQGDLASGAARWRKLRTILLETHSEHLMLRILRRIEETSRGTLTDDDLALKPEHVAVYYVEQIEGCTVVRELRVDEHGEFLDPWPRGFFEERRKELF